jgi:hypothetical protein
MSELGPTITKLEPTITEHEPTATERLRALLTERGVEWETDRSGFRVMWGKPVDEFHDTMQFKAVDNALPNGGLNVHICGFTPEQAIAATLGDSDTTGARQRDAVEVVRCRDCACFSVDDSDHDYRTGWWCKRWYTDMVMPDGFCKWGVRMEGK